MKISLEWLGDYLPGDITAEQAGETLTSGGFPVEVFEKVGDDDVIDVEVTSNRGDCLSHVGVARELSALLRRPFKDVTPSITESASRAAEAVSVRIDAPQLCPHYTARVIRGVKIGPSPQWMRRRLEAVGLRSINNVVDITNYVMFELGQPLHAFDYDKLRGRQIIVRTARAGEKLTSIDGHERTLTDRMLVIADAERPVALAGVMGGLETEVGDTTVNVLLESARFDPLVVRSTARGLAMMSDSSYRFERGISPALPAIASARAAQLIVELAGGELLSGIVEAGEAKLPNRPLSLRLQKLRQVLGVDLPTDEVIDALSRLQFAPQRQGDVINVTVPPWRLDVNIEVDLVEEVARVLGYDRIPVSEQISVRVTPADPVAAGADIINGVMVGAGYFESLTFTFASDQLVKHFVPPEAAGLPRAKHAVRKADGQLRPSLIPGLLEAVRRNETAGTSGAKLYEIGSTFWTRSDGTVEERRRLGLVGSDDLREVRGTIEQILIRLDAARPIEVVPDERPGYAKGACGRVQWGGQTVGYFGRVDPAVCDKLSLRAKPVAAELEIEALIAGAQLVPQLQALPKYPAIRRDLSFVVGEATRYEQIAGIVHKTRPEMLEDVEYVTTYRGKPLERGQKSVTITLVFRSPTTTLTSEQVEASVQRVIEAAQRDLGATLRV